MVTTSPAFTTGEYFLLARIFLSLSLTLFVFVCYFIFWSSISSFTYAQTHQYHYHLVSFIFFFRRIFCCEYTSISPTTKRKTCATLNTVFRIRNLRWPWWSKVFVGFVMRRPNHSPSHRWAMRKRFSPEMYRTCGNSLTVNRSSDRWYTMCPHQRWSHKQSKWLALRIPTYLASCSRKPAAWETFETAP